MLKDIEHRITIENNIRTDVKTFFVRYKDTSIISSTYLTDVVKDFYLVNSVNTNSKMYSEIDYVRSYNITPQVFLLDRIDLLMVEVLICLVEFSVLLFPPPLPTP